MMTENVCFYGRRACHVLFCRGEATELWVHSDLVFRCSDNFRSLSTTF